VNLEELTAQIAGNKLALRTLEAELDEDQAWNAAKLEKLVGRLEALQVKNKDLALFRDLVSPAEQALVGSLPSLRPVIAQATARAAQLRAKSQADFSGSPAERQAELRRCDELSARLRGLSAD
jgi:hypothetical protein